VIPSSRHAGSLETPYGWVVIAASCIVVAIGNASLYIAVVSLKPIAAEFGWPRSVPALAYSLAMIGSGIGGVVMGRWSDRAGLARPVALGVTMIGAGCIAASYSDSAWWYLTTHGLLVGLLGNAALYGPLMANATRWFDRRRGLAVGLVASGQALGGALLSPVFRATVDQFGWRETFSYYGVTVLAMLLPVTLLLRRRPPALLHATGTDAARDRGRTALGVPQWRVLAMLCAAIVGCCVSMSIPLVHLVSHASDLGHGLASGAEMLSIALLAAIVSRLVWGSISDRMGGLRTVFTTSAWQAIALLALAWVESRAGLYAVAAFFGLGYGGIVPAYAVFIRETFPIGRVGLNVGILVLFGTIGMALGGWLGATLFDLTGTYRPAFLTGFGFNLANLVVIGWLLARQSRHGRNPGGTPAPAPA